MRDCLHWVDMEDPAHYGQHHALGRGPELDKRGEVKLSTSKHVSLCIQFSLLYEQDVASCFRFLPVSNLELGAKMNPFSPRLILLVCFSIPARMNSRGHFIFLASLMLGQRIFSP